MTTSKLTRLADGVVMATPSPSVRIIWHHNAGSEHVVSYLGFDDAAHAETCYQWIAAKFGRYDRAKNAGVCKVILTFGIQGDWHDCCLCSTRSLIRVILTFGIKGDWH